jgi:hypothetical protein
MEILGLVRDFGVPLALLVAAVVALWRAWRLERRLRRRDMHQRQAMLLAREHELYTLYRELALRELGSLASGRMGLSDSSMESEEDE